MYLTMAYEIYILSKFADYAEFIIQQAEKRTFSAVYTPITIAETLSKPIALNRPDLADRCRSAFRVFENIFPVDITTQAGELAGALKAKYSFPPPDMMQVAVALLTAEPILITNDKELKKVREVTVFTLRDFE